MTETQKVQREERFEISLGRCEVCGKLLSQGQMQLAHRIGNTETNRKKYGSFFIDSVANAKYVCSLGCNATVDVGKSKGNILNVLIDILKYECSKFTGGKNE